MKLFRDNSEGQQHRRPEQAPRSSGNPATYHLVAGTAPSLFRPTNTKFDNTVGRNKLRAVPAIQQPTIQLPELRQACSGLRLLAPGAITLNV